MNENIFNKDRIIKSRGLKTIHDLIATNYQRPDFGSGHFLYAFQPATTDTTYQFEANFEDAAVEGGQYNIGFIEENGCEVVDLSCLSKASTSDKDFSYLYARNMPKQKHNESEGKNDSRVKYQPKDGYYWGREYAWREFGLVLSRDTLGSYSIGCVKHPTIECVAETEGYPEGEDSITFKEDGLKRAIDELIDTAAMVNKRPYFRSPLYLNDKKRFTIKGVPTITDKK